MTVELLVMGGGNMGSALVAGLVAAGREPSTMLVVDPAPERREALVGEHPGLAVAAQPEPDQAPGAGAVLAVKPDAVDSACRWVGLAGVARLLSVVAGVSSARLENRLPEGLPVIRAVPNTAALVGAAVTVMSGGSHVTAEDLDWAASLLESVGMVLRLPERHLDAVTGLSGSGPAYVFLVVEALTEAGVLSGLPLDVSEKLAVETLAGSAALLRQGARPSVLRAAVTSPGGTTAAGLRTLEARAMRSAFLEAVASATERSRQLGHVQG